MKFKLLNRKNDTDKRLKALEAEIFPKEEKKEEKSDPYNFWFPRFFYSFDKPLKTQIMDLKNDIARNEKLLKMILDFMKLEYVKITEENGEKHTKEVLRKKKRVIKKKEVEEGDED